MYGYPVLVPLDLQLIQEWHECFLCHKIIRIYCYHLLISRMHLLYPYPSWDSLMPALRHSCSQPFSHTL